MVVDTRSSTPESACHADECSTRTRILDAAEQLFADKGFEGASLRAITENAAVNLAAVNYHFSSKEGLYKEVFVRRIRPMNQIRLQMLSEVLIQTKGSQLNLRQLLIIIFQPITDLASTKGTSVHPFVRIMARNFIDPQPFMREVMQAEFGQIIPRFAPHFRAVLPHLDLPTILWRIRFIIGSANFTFGRMQVIETRLNQLGASTDGPTQLRQLVAFAEAGLMAPVPDIQNPTTT